MLNARGIDFNCFEVGSEVGGNWRYLNDNGMSSAYRSLHINTSRRMMEYATHPMPDSYPDYPNHQQIADYFDDYVDSHGFRDRIRFRTQVTRVERAEGGWEVTWRQVDGSDEGSDLYTDVIVANGHHWDARWPEPAFPGQDRFEGEQMHVHDYKTPEVLEDKRVLVLGIGNSATDIAVESSRTAAETFLAMRRGAWIVPKYLAGKPTDELGGGILSRIPPRLAVLLLGRKIKSAVGQPTDYGLPKPDHRLGEAHPTVSSDLLPRLGHGAITVKPNIAEFTGGREVHFTDGSTEEIDVVVYCTGYRITFPFLDAKIFSAPDNKVPLYRYVFSPEHEGLYFVGLVQPLGAIMPLAELQSEWIADVLQGKTVLPTADEMRREIAADRAAMAKRYVNSKRHTIEVDFEPYKRLIQKERRRET